jgi:hypothetical protein
MENKKNEEKEHGKGLNIIHNPISEITSFCCLYDGPSDQAPDFEGICRLLKRPENCQKLALEGALSSDRLYSEEIICHTH